VRRSPRRVPACLLAGLLLALASAPVRPAGAVESADSAGPVRVDIVRISRAEQPLEPLSFLDLPVEDDGAAGAELGLADNRTTGGFLGHEYRYENVRVAADADLAARVAQLVGQGAQALLLDLDETDLGLAAGAMGSALGFNVRDQSDALRNEACHANLLHVVPSRAMRADALAQYLAWKRWRKVALVTGRHPPDAAFAAALERAVARFGLDLVARADWTREPGARRTDSGHHTAQSEIPTFTRFKDHDVLLVADAFDEFGEYLPYRTERPRPVAGTQGLVPTAWSRTHEQWGATQLQRRFEALAGRVMSPRDQAGWLAMRSIGEAVTRTGRGDADAMRTFLLGPDFALAGFKGVPLSYRDWNGQLRQPILLSAARMLVSVSPQDGFLHQHSELDTLGYDRPESACEAYDP